MQLLLLFGAALVIVPTLALARLVRADRPRLAGVATVTTAIGWASVPAFCFGGLVMRAMAQAPDRDAQAQVLTASTAGSTDFVFLMAAVGAVGYIVLAVGLARSPAVPILTGLGGASTFLVVPGPMRALLLVAIALLLAGHGWTILATRTAAPATPASPPLGQSRQPA